MKNESYVIEPIAHIRSPFREKFGIPRQSGLAESVEAKIVFNEPYGESEAFRGIESYSHLWLIWKFTNAESTAFSPTVRPPKLGGNKRMGVFASRSPYRPNSLGLSCVRLLRVEKGEHGRVVLVVGGSDLMDGTPIYDVKPYIPYADSYPQAESGFAVEGSECRINVVFPPELLNLLPEDLRRGAVEALAQDPRPGYQDEPKRVYYMLFSDYEIKFSADETTLTVLDVSPKKDFRNEE